MTVQSLSGGFGLIQQQNHLLLGEALHVNHVNAKIIIKPYSSCMLYAFLRSKIKVTEAINFLTDEETNHARHKDSCLSCMSRHMSWAQRDNGKAHLGSFVKFTESSFIVNYEITYYPLSVGQGCAPFLSTFSSALAFC